MDFEEKRDVENLKLHWDARSFEAGANWAKQELGSDHSYLEGVKSEIKHSKQRVEIAILEERIKLGYQSIETAPLELISKRKSAFKIVVEALKDAQCAVILHDNIHGCVHDPNCYKCVALKSVSELIGE